MNIISIDTAHLILDAIAYTCVHTENTADEEDEKYIDSVLATTIRLFTAFCEEKGIEVIDDGTEDEDEDEDDEPDFPDDVDESNYDPYSGCDIYEVDDMF